MNFNMHKIHIHHLVMLIFMDNINHNQAICYMYLFYGTVKLYKPVKPQQQSFHEKQVE